MSGHLIFSQVADDLFEISVSTPREAQALAEALRQSPIVEDVVAGLSSVCVRFHPDNKAAASAWMTKVSTNNIQMRETQKTVEIEIQYGGTHGPDFSDICRALSLTEDQFIALHTAHRHNVEMIGFTPGFAYISGLPDTFSIPRLSAPRARVPAGSVGISSAYTGLYALQGPGGWPLIGRTEAPLFSAEAQSPFLLRPGLRVQFKAA